MYGNYGLDFLSNSGLNNVPVITYDSVTTGTIIYNFVVLQFYIKLVPFQNSGVPEIHIPGRAGLSKISLRGLDCAYGDAPLVRQAGRRVLHFK